MHGQENPGDVQDGEMTMEEKLDGPFALPNKQAEIEWMLCSILPKNIAPF